MNYASTAGGGAMTMVIVRAESKPTRPARKMRALRGKTATIKTRPPVKALEKAD